MNCPRMALLLTLSLVACTRGTVRTPPSVGSVMPAGSPTAGHVSSASVSAAPVASASVWLLTAQQRREFLHHYSPVILKRTDEDDAARAGRDWLTNAFFDGDDDLSNNRRNWERDLSRWIQGDPALSTWDVSPTIYCALLEFFEGSRKSVVLLYHVYHAMQRGSIHDWERLELRCDDVRGGPGQGERVAYAVVTRHSLHDAAESVTEPHLVLQRTPTGSHPVLWQAQWSGLLGPRKAELRFVLGTAAELEQARRRDRRPCVRVSDWLRQKLSYAFVDGADATLVGSYGAARLDQASARALAAGGSGAASWNRVRAITYELQDLADLLPTHLDPRSWRDGVPVALSSGVRAEDGSAAIPPSSTGFTTFLSTALDVENAGEDREGYPDKHWFWGAYLYGREGSFLDEWRRGLPGGVLRQHDYFAHDGRRSTGRGAASEQGVAGRWLLERDGWHEAAKGGFDGRWTQLFQD